MPGLPGPVPDDWVIDTSGAGVHASSPSVRRACSATRLSGRLALRESSAGASDGRDFAYATRSSSGAYDGHCRGLSRGACRGCPRQVAHPACIATAQHRCFYDKRSRRKSQSPWEEGIRAADGATQVASGGVAARDRRYLSVYTEQNVLSRGPIWTAGAPGALAPQPKLIHVPDRQTADGIVIRHDRCVERRSRRQNKRRAPAGKYIENGN